jgi:cobalt-zinc-cadmium efflux system membrane fusion protein
MFDQLARNRIALAVLLVAPFAACSVGCSSNIGSNDDNAETEPELGLSLADGSASSPTYVTVDGETIAAMNLAVESVTRKSWPKQLRVTGRLEMNASRVAHVSPLVAGIVQDVYVELGDRVEAGQVLARIHSREAGEAKLQLAKAQLEVESATKEFEWRKTIDENTGALLEALQQDTPITTIEEDFVGRPIGRYRDQLLSAAARRQRAQADYDRIQGLGESAVIPGKEVIRAESEVRSANASYGALLEQIRFDATHELMVSERQWKQAKAALANAQAQLRIFGYTREEIANMQPLENSETVADFPIRSPLRGTVVEKHLVSAEYVDLQTQLVEIADLSTVWLRADIFEKDLGQVVGLEGKTVEFWSPTFGGRRFKAQVFSLGSIVDDATRASRLLAVAANDEGLLKPGMFVEIELQGESEPDVVQVPGAALQHHAGDDFVFVSQGSDRFERRDVVTGRATPTFVEIREGLSEGEMIVVQGGFALKSEMLSDLMAEE